MIVEPDDLIRIYNVLEDLMVYDVSSSCFKAVLEIHTVAAVDIVTCSLLFRQVSFDFFLGVGWGMEP